MSNQLDDLLFTAVANGCLGRIQSILQQDEEEGIDINIRDNSDGGRTMLHKACLCGEENNGAGSKIVELLLANGAEVSSKDNDGLTPLHVACKNGNIPIVKLLLDNHAAVDSKNNIGSTPLSYACHDGHVDVIQLLLECGCEVNNKNNYGSTPLFFACLNGHVKVVQLLLRNNAKIDSKDNDGWTPVFYACRFGHVDVVRLLLENSTAVESQDNDGLTPNGHVDNMKMLIGYISNNINIRDNKGKTLLHISSQEGYTAIVQLLLNYANATIVNIQDDDGYTPLHYASFGGHTDTVRLLLRNGANMSMKTNYDEKTAQDLACDEDHLEIVTLMLHFVEMRQKAFLWSKRRRLRQTRYF